MGIISVEGLKGLFNKEVSSEERQQAFRDILLLVLARGSRADLHTHEAEIKVAQDVFREYFAEEVSASELRVAASSELFETVSINKQVARESRKLESADRILIIHALRDVLHADGRVRDSEIDFFNSMAGAMQLKPSDIAGITAGQDAPQAQCS